MRSTKGCYLSHEDMIEKAIKLKLKLKLKLLLHKLIRGWCIETDSTVYQALGVVNVRHSELVDELKKIEP
jgi:hypothetical protein